VFRGRTSIAPLPSSERRSQMSMRSLVNKFRAETSRIPAAIFPFEVATLKLPIVSGEHAPAPYASFPRRSTLILQQ
jgi:hypothetical protein